MFNQTHQPTYVYSHSYSLLLNFVVLTLSKKYPSFKRKYLLKEWEASIPYFNTWIRKFQYKKYKVFINVLGRLTLIFQIEERDLPCLFMYFREHMNSTYFFLVVCKLAI